MVLREEPTGFGACTVEELKRIARTAVSLLGSSGGPPVLPGFGAVPASHKSLPTRRADLVAFLSGLVSTEDAARLAYASLGEIEQAAVQEAVHDPDGVFHEGKFAAKYGRVPNFGLSSYARSRAGGECPVVRLFLPLGESLPSEARERLAAFVPKPREPAPETTESPPEWGSGIGESERTPIVTSPAQDAALRDVHAVLRLVESGRVRVGSTGRVSESAAGAIREALSAGDFYAPDIDAIHGIEADDVRVGPLGIRPFAWGMLLQAGDLARVKGGRLALTRHGVDALSASAHTVLNLLWHSWIASDLLHELNRVEVVKGQRSSQRPLGDASSGRDALAECLALLPEGRWITVPALIRFVAARGLDLGVVEDPWYLYLGELQYGSFGDDTAASLLDDRFVRAFLLEYAATLGVVDVAIAPPWAGPHDFGALWGADNLSALSRYDGLAAVRVTPLGAWILGSRSEFAGAPPAVAVGFRVLPTCDVCALGPSVPAADALFLDRVADRTSDRVWRLSRVKILAAVETGSSLDALRAFLADRSPEPLPETVIALLDDLAARTRAVRGGAAVRVVECRDEPLALLLANDASLRKLCVHGGANRLLVPLTRESAFRAALRRAGYVLPAAAD